MRKIFFLKKVQFEKSRPAFHLYSRLAICWCRSGLRLH
jgi:hypothetical protein